MFRMTDGIEQSSERCCVGHGLRGDDCSTSVVQYVDQCRARRGCPSIDTAVVRAYGSRIHTPQTEADMLRIGEMGSRQSSCQIRCGVGLPAAMGTVNPY